MDKQNDEYKTNQTGLAAYLTYCEFPIVELRWKNDSCSFVFKRSDNLLHFVNKFVSGEARVEPQAFNNHFSQVRNKMFAKRDEVKGNS